MRTNAAEEEIAADDGAEEASSSLGSFAEDGVLEPEIDEDDQLPAAPAQLPPRPPRNSLVRTSAPISARMAAADPYAVVWEQHVVPGLAKTSTMPRRSAEQRSSGNRIPKSLSTAYLMPGVMADGAMGSEGGVGWATANGMGTVAGACAGRCRVSEGATGVSQGREDGEWPATLRWRAAGA